MSLGPASPATPGQYAQRCRGQRVALLTQHGKEHLLAPLLHTALGCHVVHVTGFDTDTLGSFTRDIARTDNQTEAARRKARIGMDLSGLPRGLASEGAFGPDPFSGLLPWNVEQLVWIDDTCGLEVVGQAQGPARHFQAGVHTWEALQAFAMSAGFPAHHLVLRPQHAQHPAVSKGLADWDALRVAFASTLAQSGPGPVFVENDLRAHANPSRQALIAQAAHNLVQRLQSDCPACGRAGYWISGHTPGLPCADCGLPTRLTLRHRWSCNACLHTEERPPLDGPAAADPSRCEHCNP